MALPSLWNRGRSRTERRAAAVPRSERSTPGRRQIMPAPFIVANPGSGTTMLRLMLDAHPEIAIPPETHFLPEVIKECRRIRRRTGEFASAEQVTALIAGHRRWGDFHLDEEELVERLRERQPVTARRAIRAFYRLYAERQGKPRWGDKTPEYVLNMARLGRLLPEARFVHVIRDGRDVALSRTRWRASRGADPRPVESWARQWKRWIERARSQAPRLDGRYLEIRYEDLVLDVEPTLRRVCEFVELDWDQVMLSYHERAGERIRELDQPLPPEEGKAPLPAGHRMQKHQSATKPPEPQKVATWVREMSAEDQAAFEGVAGDLLAALDYEVGIRRGARSRGRGSG